MRATCFWAERTSMAADRSHLPTDVRGKDRWTPPVISGILHVLESGCRGRLPASTGPPTDDLCNRVLPLGRARCLGALFRELAARCRSCGLKSDSTHFKAHRSAAGGKGGA